MDEIKKEKSKKVTRYFADTEAKIESNGESKVNIESGFSGIVVNCNENAKSRFKSKRKRDSGPVFKRPPVPDHLLEKHSRGEGIRSKKGIKSKYQRKIIDRKEKRIEQIVEHTARTEILLNETDGFIEPDENEDTREITQSDIIQHVDITAATKHFNLDLEFGPYKSRYTRNGRHLLLGGRKGHVAAFDWVTKRLHCEMNVMEDVHAIEWLHLETMFAVAQKTWVHFYDNRGTEIHCVKKLNRVTHMEFLPYHFLLAILNDQGFMKWLDVSIGDLAGELRTNQGNIRTFCQNPYNGVVCTGGSKGVVSMWSPTMKEPLAQMLCHSAPMTAMTVDPRGKYLVTSGLDKLIKVWDVRQLEGPLAVYKLHMAPSEIQMSQRGILGVGFQRTCLFYNKPEFNESELARKEPYLIHRCPGNISDLRFCPYEDVAAIGTDRGFTSILVPGAGEPNFDSREANPFQSKSQRREAEVHALLEKVPKEFITLDPNKIMEVDVPTLKDKIEAKKKLMYLKAPKIDFKPRHKMKGKGGSVNAARNKKIVKETIKKDFNDTIKDAQKNIINKHRAKDTEQTVESGPSSVLDRFIPLKKKKQSSN